MFVLTELGNVLKQAREAKGLSLDDLQNLTKIQKRYLVGIENGNYDFKSLEAFKNKYVETHNINNTESVCNLINGYLKYIVEVEN